MSEANRAYTYRLIVAAIPLAILAGVVIDNETGQLILNFAAAALGLGASGLATAHTSTSGEFTEKG